LQILHIITATHALGHDVIDCHRCILYTTALARMTVTP
jgi:hypothetical protein